MLVSPIIGDRKAKGTAAAVTVGLDPDPAAMFLHDAMHQRKADAGTLDTRIEPFEQAENLVVIGGIDAAAIVLDVEYRVRLILASADPDSGIGMVAAELDCIFGQVLQNLA